MAVLRASLRNVFSQRWTSWSPPLHSLSLSVFLSTARDPFSDSSHNARWKPLCLYHTQGKCTRMDDPIHVERFNHDFSREAQLNTVELNKIRSQNLDFFLVLALEVKVEIIEFPVLLINAKTTEVEDIFHRFVRPSKLSEERINRYIEGLYGKLGVDRVWHDTAIPFNEVIQQFEAWLVQRQLWMGEKLNQAAFVSCGNSPLHKYVPRQCEVSKIKLPSYFMEWIKLTDVYMNTYNRKVKGMMETMRELQIPSLGSQRLGIDRAKQIARIMQHMLVDGALMQITARRNPKPPGGIEFLYKKIR